MRSSLYILIAFLCAAVLRAQEATVWTEHRAGNLTFMLPQRWEEGVKPPGKGELFLADVPGLGTFRVRELPAPSAPQAGLPGYNDVHEVPVEWKEVAAGLPTGTKVDWAHTWSRLNGAVVLDYANFKGKGPTDKNTGTLIARWRTEGKPGLAVEVTYPRDDRGIEREVGDLWETLTYEPASKLAFRRPGSKLPTPGVRPASSAPPAETKKTPAQLMQEYAGSLVFMEGGGGAGSGFICRMKEGVFLLTNQHVAAAMKTVKATRLDGQAVTLGEPGAAVGHDLMRFAGVDAPHPFVAGEEIENFAKIGDDIVVLGNAEGSRVITPLPGKLLGLGPDRIEVNAEFVPGNSGSPIIHLATGRVLGIATYLEHRRYAALGSDKDAKIRRFGYRLDSVKQWQRVNWGVFQSESQALGKVEALTKDFGQLLDDLESTGKVFSEHCSTPLLQRLVRDFAATVNKNGVSPTDRQRAIQNFAASLRAGTQADIADLRPRLQYDFFRTRLTHETGVRDEMYKIFDQLAKKLVR